MSFEVVEPGCPPASARPASDIVAVLAPWPVTVALAAKSRKWFRGRLRDCAASIRRRTAGTRIGAMSTKIDELQQERTRGERRGLSVRVPTIYIRTSSACRARIILIRGQKSMEITVTLQSASQSIKQQGGTNRTAAGLAVS